MSTDFLPAPDENLRSRGAKFPQAAQEQPAVLPRADFTHAGQVSGVKIIYRVTARRAKMVSPASNLASVYAQVPAAKSGAGSAA